MNRDKARILKVISDVIDASRLLANEHRRLTRNKLLALMNERRPHHMQLSRDEFQNYFTTRVDRKSIVPVEDLLCLIEVILENYADCVTAEAILELCDAARLPLREYRRISQYFSVSQWDKAWQLYNAAQSSTFQGELVFASRESLVKEIYQHYSHKKVILLSGYSGTGKTRVGLRICTMLEADNYRICLLSGHDINSIESFVVHLSNQLHLRTFGNESLFQRLQYYIQDNPIFVFVDDLSLQKIDDIYALLSHISRLLPSIRLMITTNADAKEEVGNPAIHSVVLSGLNYDEAQLLFRQSCYQLGSFAIDMRLVADQLGQCDGNPMAIKMLAYIVSQHGNYIQYHHLSDTLAALTVNESYVIRLLLVFDSFISIDFVSYISGLDDEELSSTIQSLIHKGLIALHNYSLLMCHAPVRMWFQGAHLVVSSVQIDICTRLIQLQDDKYMLPHSMMGIQHSDIDQLISLLKRMVIQSDDEMIDAIVSLLLKWRWHWCVMEYESDILSICGHLIAKKDSLVQDSKFMLLRAMLYWRIDDIELARSMLTTIEVVATMSGHLELVAQAKLEMALTYAKVSNQVIFMTYIRQAQQLFERLEMREWCDFSIIQQAKFLIHEGYFEKAIAHCDEVEGSVHEHHYYLQYLVSYTRMNAYFYLGTYGQSYKWLIRAQHFQKQTNIYSHKYELSLYEWSIRHFQQRDKKGESYNSAWKTVSQLTQIPLILLFADLLTLALFEDEYIEQAMLVYRIASHFRNESSIRRVPYIETLLEQKVRASIILYNPLSLSVDVYEKMSVYEIMAHLKHVLNQVSVSAPKVLLDT